tara:strand:- start:11302 stop:11862 length:561 start_codon:yes stop_codon:yes gene_type:complete
MTFKNEIDLEKIIRRNSGTLPTISQREIMRISEILLTESTGSISFETIEKKITNLGLKKYKMEVELKLMEDADGLQIRIYNQLKRMNPENRTQNQGDLLLDYSLEEIMIQSQKFRQALLEMIASIQEDLDNLNRIKGVYISMYPEAIISPRTPRSELETSPIRMSGKSKSTNFLNQLMTSPRRKKD